MEDEIKLGVTGDGLDGDNPGWCAVKINFVGGEGFHAGMLASEVDVGGEAAGESSDIHVQLPVTGGAARRKRRCHCGVRIWCKLRCGGGELQMGRAAAMGAFHLAIAEAALQKAVLPLPGPGQRRAIAAHAG